MFADWLQLFESDAVAFNIEKQIEHSLRVGEKKRDAVLLWIEFRFDQTCFFHWIKFT